ncbi:MAG: dGTP triphosphohydrolase [Deinococcota bacterium]
MQLRQFPSTPDNYQQSRDARRHKLERQDDSRSPAQRDRDRILHSSAFRRLAGITQVVAPSEGYVFHTRLTHTLEVAQISRRIAERFCREVPELVAKLGGIDPDTVEAAALAHDLGHPPFGHTGERVLNSISKAHSNSGVFEGFEGNAQSFRIITTLAAHRDVYPGLNLTRATLSASLKYPWFQDSDYPAHYGSKYGVYRSEQADYDFAREGVSGLHKTLEAELMDYADDVAYSVYDLDDFYRVGMIPLDRLAYDGISLTSFLNAWKADAARGGDIRPEHIKAHQDAFQDLLDSLVIDEVYRGTFEQRALLRTRASSLIRDWIMAVRLRLSEHGQSALDIPHHTRMDIAFLKRIVRQYLIGNPRLATQRHGHEQIITMLFNTYLEAVCKRNDYLVPARFNQELEQLPNTQPSQHPSDAAIRLAVDIVAHFTDAQALHMYRRLSGIAPGAISDFIDV